MLELLQLDILGFIQDILDGKFLQHADLYGYFLVFLPVLLVINGFCLLFGGLYRWPLVFTVTVVSWLFLQGGFGLLSVLILFPLIACFYVALTPADGRVIRSLGLLFSLATFLLSMVLWVLFDDGGAALRNGAPFQFVEELNVFVGTAPLVTFGVDSMSLFFIILTTFLIPMCILTGWEGGAKSKEYVIAFLALEGLLIAVFTTLDLVLFYIFFESVLIPMFILIGIFGSRSRKIRAAYQFFLYTLFGSLLMLLAILMIYFQAGTTDLLVLMTTEFSEASQLLLWLAFFASFAIKVPMVPFHIWLPEAHAEAPTAGSVILAGILLKLGGYGFLRFSVPLFPEATLYFTPIVFLLSVIGVIYVSLTTLRQVDMKKIIAYSSVAHMAYVTIGIFTMTAQGISGAIFLMLSHGIVSGALFLLVGVLYDRYKTRLIKYYGGLAQAMPIFATTFLFFTMANLALPGTSSFVGELLVLIGAIQSNTTMTFLAATGMVLGGAYSIWLYNRIAFGNLKTHYISAYLDMNRREFAMLLPFIILVLWLGVYPEPILRVLDGVLVSYTGF